jgi:hypothetical protein
MQGTDLGEPIWTATVWLPASSISFVRVRGRVVVAADIAARKSTKQPKPHGLQAAALLSAAAALAKRRGHHVRKRAGEGIRTAL